ncbi:MAG: Imm27 family immunity protein [Devosia sp.]
MELIGDYVLEGNRVVGNETERAINLIVDNHLVEVGRADKGWTIILRDDQNGQLWELSRSQGEMQGGGPKTLRTVTIEHLRAQYGEELEMQIDL